MNKSIFYLLFAALVALYPLHAQEVRVATDRVKVSLNHKNINGPQRFVPLQLPSGGDIFKDVDKKFRLSSLDDYKGGQWYVYNVPICITAQARGTSASGKASRVPANVINQLKVKVYMIYTSEGLKKLDASMKNAGKGTDEVSGKIFSGYRLTEKEITYVNIPMNKVTKKEDKGDEVGYVEMSVGLFAPRTVITQMTQKKDPTSVSSNADLTIVAYAVEATFNRTACPAVNVPGVSKGSKSKDSADAFSYIRSGIDSEISSGLSDRKWWKSDSVKSHFLRAEKDLLCISETPFAPYYNSMYPATKPLYGEPEQEMEPAGDSVTPPGVPSTTTSSSSGTGADDTEF